MGPLLSEAARPVVDRPDVMKGRHLARARLLIGVHRGGYQNWYGQERNSPVEKCRHCDFISRVQHNRQPGIPFQCTKCKTKAWKTAGIRRFEVQPGRSREVE